MTTPGFNTRAIHAGQEPDPATGAVILPVHLTTTYKQDGVGGLRGGYEYSRSGNPTRAAWEAHGALLEGAAHGFAFSSGLAAEDALLRLVAAGDHALLPDDAYGGTIRLALRVHAPAGLVVDTVDLTDLDAVEAAWRPDTRLVWLETPSNPWLRIIDIEAISALAHERGAHVVVDNTFATPLLQQPLTLEADLVVHSATKFIAGHSDVLMGAVVTRSAELYEVLKKRRDLVGNAPGPFEAWLALRGLRTLSVRLDRAQANARELVERLAVHPAVEEVRYPGFGAIVAAVLSGGGMAADLLTRSTELWVHATSLGGVESTFERRRRWKVEPATIPDGLVRMSVGIEHVDDLWDDLAQALDAIPSPDALA